MLNRKLMITAVLTCGLAGLGLAPTAEAALLYNQTTNTTMFQTGWEDGPNHDIDGNGNVLNHTATVGTIVEPIGSSVSSRAFVYTEYSDTNIQPAVTPYSGDQFLRTYTFGTGSRGGIGLLKDAGASSDAGDTITFSTMFYSGRGLGMIEVFHGTDPAEDRTIWINLMGDGEVRSWTGSANDIITATHTPGEWNKVVIEYINGQNVATISINGSTPEQVATFGSGNIMQVELRMNSSNSDAFWDAIPEPASLTLLGLGGLLMLRRRRRQ